MTRQHYTKAKTSANTRSKTWTPSSSPPRASSSAPKQWPQRCIAAKQILSTPLGTFEFVESRATSGRTTNNGVPGLSFGRTTARPTLVSSFYCLNGTESAVTRDNGKQTCGEPLLRTRRLPESRRRRTSSVCSGETDGRANDDNF